MTIWVDAQLSPLIAKWISRDFAVRAIALRELELRDSADREIFNRARAAQAVILTKDLDFVLLLEKFGPPPKILWLTCGNTSNARLRNLLGLSLQTALDLLKSGESLVEISDAPPQ